MYNRPKKITRKQINKLIRAGKTDEIIEAHNKNKEYYFLNISAEMERLRPGQKEAMEEYFVKRLKAGQRKFCGLSKSDTDFLINEFNLDYLNKKKIEPPKELNEFQQFIADQFKKVGKNLDFSNFKIYSDNAKEYFYRSWCKRACFNPKSPDVKAAFNYLVYN